ncbi:MAG TPA: DNA polymerase I [Polyangiaceae bacterium]|jgi:DNA polymerase-1|nr:DNA polymerase I [Polyangiaceae bacterium]
MPTRLFETAAPDVLYLVDLSGYVFRAYHAIAPLASPSGEPTHAVFGTVNMLERLVRQCRPERFAVAMDSRTPTFRKELYPEYKATRPAPPDDLKQQMRRVMEVIEAFPIPCFQKDGFEADDLIASVVKQCRANGMRTVIVSADKDLMQLVGDDVVLWDTMRDKVFGVEEVRERFGVELHQVRDALALMGDTSDNIPGVAGVGPKTAKDLLSQYGDLDGIYRNLDQIKAKKLKESLREHETEARMSQRLVTLKDDIELPFSPTELHFARSGNQRIRALYTELGFTRQLAALPPDDGANGASAAGPDPANSSASTAASSSTRPTTNHPNPAPAQPVEIKIVSDPALLEEIARGAREAKQLAVFPLLIGETTLKASVIGIGLASSPELGYYVPLAHRLLDAPRQLAESQVFTWLGELLAEPGLSLSTYDSKSTLVVLQQRGAQIPRADFDARLSAYLLDSGASVELERIVKTELDLDLPTRELRFRGKGNKQIPVDQVPIDEAASFTAERAALLLRLRKPLETHLEEDTLWKLYSELELPLAPILASLEQVGVAIDTALLATIGSEVNARLQALEKEAQELAGNAFNVHSPRQLEKLLFDDLGLKPLKRTKTSRSTDAETLEALSEQYPDQPLPAKVLEIRQLAKLKGTYIDALPGLINPKTKRLHTVWHQEVAATGRLSSSDPNLQNIPIRTELGQRIREAFVAPAGCALVSADYSQIELRVLAHLSQDPVLVEAFRTGQDIHQRTAMEIFEIDADEVTADLRRQAKAVNFGVIYGQGDSALSKSLGISRLEAGQFIAAYFRRYAGVTRFMNETLENARASGSVRTSFDRRRLVPDLTSSNRARRLAAERIAMNTPIQGTAADIMKLAMLALAAPVTPGARMILTVHDELVFEVPHEEVPEARERIKKAMQEVTSLSVPLVVDVGAGPNWRAAH